MESFSVLLLIVNYTLVFLAIYLTARQRGPLLNPAWALILGYFVNYCVKPTLFIFSPTSSTLFTDLTDVSTAADNSVKPLAMAILFFVSFMTATLMGSGSDPGLARRIRFNTFNEFTGSRACLVPAFAMIFGGAVAMALFIRDAGWTGSLGDLLLGQARNKLIDNMFGKGYYTALIQLAPVGWCIYALHLVHRRKSFFRPAALFLFIVSVSVPLIFGQRIGIVCVVLSAVLILNGRALRIRRGKLKKQSIATALVAVFLVAGPLGLIMKNRSMSLANVILIATSAWDSFELQLQIKSDSEGQFLYGQSYAEDLFYSYLPRLWFDKPDRYGILRVQDIVAPALGYSAGTYPPGMMLEAYYNFSWFGLIIVPALMGVACRSISRRIASGSNYWILQGIFVFVGVASFRCLGDVMALVMFQSLVLAFSVAVCRPFYIPSKLVSDPMELSLSPGRFSPIAQNHRRV